MAANNVIRIEVKGLDVLEKKLKKFPERIKANMSAAAEEAGKEVLWTKGLQTYPSETEHNKPPYPFYIRGRGEQMSPNYNRGGSEKLGSQFYIKREGFGARIGNRASYAEKVIGDGQRKLMKDIGWRKLIDVANEKIGKIRKIFDGWVAKTIRDLGL